MTEIERLRKRIDDSLKRLTRDTNKLFDMVEGRGQLIDTLAREKEQLQAYNNKLAGGLPDGMLPKDVELLRKANAGMATQIVQLEKILEDVPGDTLIQKIKIRRMFHERWRV